MRYRALLFAAPIVWLRLGMPALSQTAPLSPAGRTYYLAFLMRDPDRRTLSKEDSDRIMAAHMAHIHEMADRGALASAGPFDDTPSAISGLFVFKTPTLDKARQMAMEDPTVVTHRNSIAFVTWRGPGGIGEEYARLHRENPATPEDMGVHPFVLLRRTTKPMEAEVRAKHAAYWERLRGEGKTVAAGPVVGDASITELLIFARIPDTEAIALAAADPAVSEGALTLEAHRWYCAAHMFLK